MKIFYKYGALIFTCLFLMPLFSFASSKRVAVIVNSSLRNGINENLEVYINDLKGEDYNPILISWNLEQDSTPRSLKDKLIELYNEEESLQGAVLIGDLPIPIMHSTISDMVYSFSTNPYYIADLYYMDLIGKEWDEFKGYTNYFINHFAKEVVDYFTSDEETNLEYLLKKTKNNLDKCTIVNLGDLFPEVEIWVSRVPVSTLGILGSEVDLINNYLEKNHAYRSRKIIFPKKALVYFDPQEESFVNAEIGVLKDSYETTVLTPNSQNDFLRPLTKYDSEIFAWRRHGHPYAIMVETGKAIFRRDAFLFSSEVIDYVDSINTAFIFALSCNIGAYTTESYFAGSLQFKKNSFILATSTGTTPMFASSAMMSDSIKDFINGDNFGEAFKTGLNRIRRDDPFLGIMASTNPNYVISRAMGRNGMYILGDGTLRLQHASTGKESLHTAFDSLNLQDFVDLLRQNPNIDLKDNEGNSLIFSAIKRHDFQKAQLLIDNGADIRSVSKSGDTPLIAAIHKRSEKIVEMLIEARAEINTADEFGCTPLMHALKNSDKKLATLLIKEAEAEINSTNLFGATPLMYAVQNSNKELATLLIQSGANLNTRDLHGKTLGVIAVQNKDYEMLELLLKSKLNITLKSRNGSIILDETFNITNAKEVLNLIEKYRN